MPKKHLKEYTAKLKFQVVLETLGSSKSDGEIARTYNVHPIMLSKWKRHFLDNGPEIFSGNDQIKQYEKCLSDLGWLLGQKEVEIALLKIF